MMASEDQGTSTAFMLGEIRGELRALRDQLGQLPDRFRDVHAELGSHRDRLQLLERVDVGTRLVTSQAAIDALHKRLDEYDDERAERRGEVKQLQRLWRATAAILGSSAAVAAFGVVTGHVGLR